LADAASPAEPVAAAVTDAIADAMVAGAMLPATARAALATLAAMACPALVEVGPAEGFAFYALHPSGYRALAARAAPKDGGPVVVIGIRTVGVALGAAVRAELRARGCQAVRLTVRPSGHPYDRRARFTAPEQRALRAAADADFFIVDEGPGQSGSSFLAVGEALLALGVESRRIAFLGSRAVDPTTLVAQGAAERWRRFRSHAIEGGPTTPDDAGTWLGAGAWRSHFYADPASAPPCWAAVERAKFLSRDGARVYKFEGLGAYADGARERARALVGAGLLPPGSGEHAGDGYLAYPRIDGRPLERRDLCVALVEQLADYCALRGAAFPAEGVDLAPLEEMVRFNAASEIGRELRGLELRRPVIPDARMAPHEFRARPDGALYKLDSAGDGDDHLMPGPTDIAWDLAGAIFEWDMPDDAAQAFVERYSQRSGDDPRDRLREYVFAYGVFRTAYWKMAVATAGGTPEEPALVRAYEEARAELERRSGGGRGEPDSALAS
jgi:hypothetical protein